MSAKAIIAVFSSVVVAIAVGVMWIRGRGGQLELTGAVALSVSARLHGNLTQAGRQWRIDAFYEERPVVLMLGGKFILRSDTDSGRDFVPTLDIIRQCSTSVQLVVHGNLLGGANYLRNLWARMWGRKLSTGAMDFDSRFLVEGIVPSDVLIVDEGMRKRFLASNLALNGRSWEMAVGGGLAKVHEVFDEDNKPATATEIASEVLSRVDLLCALAANAERLKPGGTPATP